MNEHHSVIVIGAGLSGLYAAWRLQQQQQDVIVLEARERTGGRILSSCINEQSDACVDLGPAWVWPQLQSRLQQLLAELDVNVFKQYTHGDMLYELDAQNLQRYDGQSSHSQSCRIVGGSRAIIDALQSQLATSAIHLNTQVTAIDQQSLSINATRDGQACLYSADKIILAVPLRIAHQSITFDPPLPDDVSRLWANTPTWMAGHSKIVFIYEKAFWREANLSGEVFSRQGPLSEIYDGSPSDESFYALTAFVGLNAHQRKQIQTEELIESCLAQLERLFGEASRNVKSVKIKDWSTDVYTTTDVDLNIPAHHPQYPDSAPRSFFNNKVFIAGTESAREHGGYLEGALESVDDALLLLQSIL